MHLQQKYRAGSGLSVLWPVYMLTINAGIYSISGRTILDFNIKFYVLAFCLLYICKYSIYVWKTQTYLYMTPLANVLRWNS
jgi:hypothetical protein